MRVTGPLTAWTSFSGKRTAELRIPADGRWHRLDVETDPDPADGLVWHMLYAHAVPQWKRGRRAGSLLVRYMRHNDPDGATAYHCYPATRGMGVSWLPVQPTHFEVGRKGVGGHWEVRVKGGLAAVVITTRYAKAQGVT